MTPLRTPWHFSSTPFTQNAPLPAQEHQHGTRVGSLRLACTFIHGCCIVKLPQSHNYDNYEYQPIDPREGICSIYDTCSKRMTD